MARGEIRYCACGCGEPAKRVYSNNQFKSWRAYAPGHAPCERCNAALGLIGDDGELLEKFADYLDKHNTIAESIDSAA